MKNSKILGKVKTRLVDISNIGKGINNTQELTNVSFSIGVDLVDLDREEIAIKEYYNSVIKENYGDRMKMEGDHYKFLEHAMKHKLNEINYFFKLKDYSSRKYIVFSGDCISCIQLLIRDGVVDMTVFMRSSDALRLLPVDILYCAKMMKEVLKSKGILKNQELDLHFWITSMHYYDKDTEIVNKIIGD